MHRSNHGATLSLSAYRQRAQAFEVKISSFFEYFYSICEYIVTIFVDWSIFACRVHRTNYGATLSLSAYRRRARASEVKVSSFLEYFYSICE